MPEQIPVPPTNQTSTTQMSTPTMKVTTTTKASSSITPLQYLVTAKDIQDHETHFAAQQKAVKDKYASVDSMEKHDKIKFLKDANTNPFMLKPYDGLASSFERWKSVAWSADLHSREGKPADYKTKVASGYYDKVLAPLYNAGKLEPMSKELWMKQAYDEALNYDIHDAYNNSMVHDIKHGLDNDLPATARAFGFMTNVAGQVLDGVVHAWKNKQVAEAQSIRARALEFYGKDLSTDKEREFWNIKGQDAVNVQAWYTQLGKQGVIKTEPEKPSSLSAHIQEGAKIQDAKHQFFAQALPEYDGWFNHATSFVAGQIAQAPIYAAMMLGNEAAGVAGGANLTRTLMSNPLGAKLVPYLMAGTEGTAYGVLTRPQGDKLQAWKDGVGFMAFHGLFDVGGMGLKKLIEMVPKGSSELERLHRRQDALELAQEGKRKATPVEQYQEHVKEVSNNLAVGGVEMQQEIFKEALSHVEETSGMTKPDRVKYEHDLLDRDPAHAGPMLASVSFLRKLVPEGTKLSELDEAGLNTIQQKLNLMLKDAASSMNKNVINLDEHIAPKVDTQVDTAGGKKTFAFYKAQEIDARMKEDPVAFKMLKPEQIDALAKRRMVIAEKRAAVLTERKLTENPGREVKNIVKRISKDVKKANAAIKANPGIQIRSERTVNKYGEPAVRYSVNPEYKVQLGLYSKAAKSQGKTLEQFFEDMPDEDFVRDLTTHFYPKPLKETSVYFEHQNTREGMQNPNFLGFMYNYIDKMPKEFGKALESRLIDTMKIQKFMNGKKPTEPQLGYFARAMWNHVDNFLGSGRWPKESNIFRSTQDNMWNSTEWQSDLLRERMHDEQKILRKAFSGNKEGLKNAIIGYNLLVKERLNQYAKGPSDMLSQEYIRMTSERITKLLTQTGKYEKVDF